MSYVYLLFRTDRPGYFKIGYSSNPLVRINKICTDRDCVDINATRIIHTPIAKHLERILHYRYRDFRYSFGDLDGDSEWFSQDCYNDLIHNIGCGSNLLIVSDMSKFPQNINTNLPTTTEEPTKFHISNEDAILSEANRLKEPLDIHTFVERLMSTGMVTSRSYIDKLRAYFRHINRYAVAKKGTGYDRYGPKNSKWQSVGLILPLDFYKFF